MLFCRAVYATRPQKRAGEKRGGETDFVTDWCDARLLVLGILLDGLGGNRGEYAAAQARSPEEHQRAREVGREDHRCAGAGIKDTSRLQKQGKRLEGVGFVERALGLRADREMKKASGARENGRVCRSGRWALHATHPAVLTAAAQ